MGYIGKSIKYSLTRSLVSIVRRPILFMIMTVVPLLSAWILLDLMKEGAPMRVPIAIVDQDNSTISRRLGRSLDAMSAVEVKCRLADFDRAKDAVQRGEIMGFIYIPRGLEDRALSGRQPMISYYINYAYYTPASFQFRGFQTITVLANGAIAKGALSMAGLKAQRLSATMGGIQTHVHGIGNPWTSYSYYLNLSFPMCLLVLLVMQLTCFSIGTEFKYGTCRYWLRSSGGSMWLAIVTKLAPHTVLFTATGWCIQFMMYRIYHLPLNCPPSHMLIAVPLLVMASQAWAVTIVGVAPNFRLSTMLCSLMGVLSFSFCGFSLPAESLYPWVHSIGSIMPIRYFFLLSVDQALNGIPLYYSRFYYAALLGFLLLPCTLTWRIKRQCLNPVYVP